MTDLIVPLVSHTPWPSIVGERFVRAANYALENRCPMICFAASGGARMTEGLIPPQVFEQLKPESIAEYTFGG